MSRQLLTAWLNEHRPELAARIANMPLELVRKVLNNETGLNVLPGDFMDASCALYLHAFMKQQEQPKLPPKISNRVLRRMHSQRGQRNGRGGRYKRFPPRQRLSDWVVARIIEEILWEEKAR